MDLLLIPAFIVLLIIILLVALALLLYAIPIRAAVSLTWNRDRRETSLHISWGCIAIRSSGSGAKRVNTVLFLGHPVLSHTGRMETGDPKDRNDEMLPEPGPGGEDTVDIGELIPLVHRMIGPVGTFGSVFWHQSQFEEARGTVMLGLGDPVLTGEVYGWYWSSRFVFLASRIDIEMEPVFDRTVLDLDITVRVKVVHPLIVLIAGLSLATDPATKEAAAYGHRRNQDVSGA